MNAKRDRKSNLNDRKCVNSLYNLREIFSFLQKKKLMNIIIYNKQLQKEYGYNKENYINASGKYKIGKRDGKVKIYILNTNILLFEGNYLKGEKNGKGKEILKMAH